MQVKKYEARTMNEALEMVKRDLGPDAIILSARDRRGKFGLVGDGSVEITAAVSEETLQKRRYAESRMKVDVREKFQNSSARVQREIMNDFVDSYVQKAAPGSPRRGSSAGDRAGAGANAAASRGEVRPPTNRRYIDIEDDANVEAEQASVRIRDAAQRAWEAMRDNDGRQARQKAQGTAPMAAAPKARGGSGGFEMMDADRIRNTLVAEMHPSSAAAIAGAQAAHREIARESGNPVQAKSDQSQAEIQSLKSELESLKSVLRDFQKIPQSLSGTHPGAEYGLSYDFSSSFEKLTQAGITAQIAGEILQTAQSQLPAIKHKSRGLIDGFAAKYILDSTKVTGISKSRIHCFVGPRGSGKTSALVKMASHAVVTGHRKLALITCDNQKVGAIDQMRIFAQILNVPFGVVRKATDWKPLLEQLQGFDMVLCDFPGMSLKTMEEVSLLTSLMPPEASEVHLALSACSKDAELEEICRRFEVAKYSSFIFNHLDEALVHGSIYNIMRKFDRPLHSFGVGPQVPEDFEAATKERVLDLIFRLTKFKRQSAE
jgi:flagellar biosynthesis protein FlhF